MGIVGIGGPFGQVPEAWPLRVKPLAVGWRNHTWQFLACRSTIRAIPHSPSSLRERGPESREVVPINFGFQLPHDLLCFF